MDPKQKLLKEAKVSARADAHGGLVPSPTTKRAGLFKDEHGRPQESLTPRSTASAIAMTGHFIGVLVPIPSASDRRRTIRLSRETAATVNHSTQ